MRRNTLVAGAALAACVAGLIPLPSHAANWHHPYTNVDRTNDAGNDTGDSQVDRLNAAQLNQNYSGPWYFPNGRLAPGAGRSIAPPPAFPGAPPRY